MKLKVQLRFSKTVCSRAKSAVSALLDTVSEHLEDEWRDDLVAALERQMTELFAALLAERARKPEPPVKAAKPADSPNRRPGCRCKSQFCGEARPKE